MFFIYVFFSGLLTALTVTFLVRSMARRYRIGALPNPRTMHQSFTPIMGGLGIAAGFIIALLTGFLFRPELIKLWNTGLSSMLLAIIVILMTGILDDKFTISPFQKLSGQALSALILLFGGCAIQQISVLGFVFPLGILSWPLTFLWIVGVMNAVNLMDGLDGLAAGVSLIVSIIFAVLAWLRQDVALILLSLSLISGIAGFLKYNFRPASIFMGDTGSLFLGLMLAVLSLKSFRSPADGFYPATALIALGVPVGDTVLAFFRRLYQGNHPFKADKDHLHHRLIFLGISHLQAVLVIYFASILYMITALTMSLKRGLIAHLSLAVILVISVLALRRLGYLEAREFKTIPGDGSVIQVAQAVGPISLRRLVHRITLITTDLLSINLAFLFTWWVRFDSGFLGLTQAISWTDMINSPVLILLSVFWTGLFFINNLYQMRWDISRFEKVRRVSRVIIFGMMVIFLTTIDPDNLLSSGRIALAIYFMALLFLVNAGRLLLIAGQKYFSIMEYARHASLLIGASEKSRKLLRTLMTNPHLRYNFVGILSREPLNFAQFAGLPVLGTYEDIQQVVLKNSIEEIVVAIDERSRDQVMNIIAPVLMMKVQIKILPHMDELLSGHKREETLGHPLIHLFPENMYLWQWMLKRILDISASGLLILMLSPLFLLIGFWMILSGKSNPLRVQNVVGRDNEIFGLLNFDANPADRHRLNRFLWQSRLYKLPALLNILIGKMSFVGPRPEEPENVNLLRQKIRYYNRRFIIKPGLTGWAQIRYRYDEALKHQRELLRFDLFYLENMSLTFDIRIIVRSVLLFLSGWRVK